MVRPMNDLHRSWLRILRLLRQSWPRTIRLLGSIWAVIWRTLVKYTETDGEQRAASFAYYAFFSLFPLIVLLITIGHSFHYSASRVMEFVTKYVPVEAGREDMVRITITDFVPHNKVGGLALLILAWSSLRFFQALVRGVNKAWGTKEYSWWRLPIQNLMVVGIVAGALILGLFVPAVINVVEYYYWQQSWTVGLDFAVATRIFQFCRFIVPPLILFYGFSIFYRVAPQRRTRFREVWFAALLVTFGLQGLQKLFVLYTTNITDFNRIYGALGSAMAMLLWIYLSGSLIIIGGCLSAAQWEIDHRITDQSERSTRR
jgi:YihY family inner membrane protein